MFLAIFGAVLAGVAGLFLLMFFADMFALAVLIYQQTRPQKTQNKEEKK